ncbi:MAG: DNA-3-methyladenine glycosylase [Patescibacteria group bacterium]
MTPLSLEWFADDAVTLAPRLLGKIVRYGECVGRIVETEAYTTDPASHGRVITPRSRIMQDTYGHWYVYFTYGMHYCANVTTNKDSVGAVLIRAVEPLEGMKLMEKRRRTKDIHNLCSGPAKFAQAFGITKAENGLPVEGDFVIYDAPAVPKEDIVSGPRIGIKAGLELPWRFYVRDSPFTSGKRPAKAL